MISFFACAAILALAVIPIQLFIWWNQMIYIMFKDKEYVMALAWLYLEVVVIAAAGFSVIQ